MISFEEKINEGKRLGERLSKYGLELARNMPKGDSSSKTESNRRALIKAFLISASQLAGQIIIAVSNGSLNLAIVGIRTLLEFDINANYIFDNHQHQQDLHWVDSICIDILDRTHDPEKIKSMLGGVTLKVRAESIGRPDLYNKNYVSLCDYTHLMLRQPFLNNRPLFEKLSVDVISQTLCNLFGVIDSVLIFQGLKFDEMLKKDIISYRDRYESCEKDAKSD